PQQAPSGLDAPFVGQGVGRLEHEGSAQVFAASGLRHDETGAYAFPEESLDPESHAGARLAEAREDYPTIRPKIVNPFYRPRPDGQALAVEREAALDEAKGIGPVEARLENRDDIGPRPSLVDPIPVIAHRGLRLSEPTLARERAEGKVIGARANEILTSSSRDPHQSALAFNKEENHGKVV